MAGIIGWESFAATGCEEAPEADLSVCYEFERVARLPVSSPHARLRLLVQRGRPADVGDIGINIAALGVVEKGMRTIRKSVQST